MVTETTGLNNFGSSPPDARKPAIVVRQLSSGGIETERPVDKPLGAHSVTAVQLPDEASVAEPQKKDSDTGVLSADELREMLDDINNALYSMNKSLKFEIHDKTDDLVVRVINTRTDEVIRQYPSEEVLARKERLLQGETSAFSTRVD